MHGIPDSIVYDERWQVEGVVEVKCRYGPDPERTYPNQTLASMYYQ